MGLLSGLFGGGSQQVQNKPWEGVRPYLGGLYYHTSQLPQQQYYPYNTVSPLAQQQKMALNQIQNRAMQGSPVTDAAQTMAANTLNGQYLFGGDAFDRAYQAASNRIIPQVQSQFGAAGRTGSGANQEALSRSLADAFASQYGDERQRQMQAALMSPSLANADYTDLNALMGVGDINRAYDQQVRDANIARWNFNQQAPYNTLNFMSGIYNGAQPYGQSTTTQSGSPAAGALGGGLLGAGIFGPAIQNAAFGGIGAGTAASSPLWALSGPWGMGAGILGGALLGGLLA